MSWAWVTGSSLNWFTMGRVTESSDPPSPENTSASEGWNWFRSLILFSPIYCRHIITCSVLQFLKNFLFMLSCSLQCILYTLQCILYSNHHWDEPHFKCFIATSHVQLGSSQDSLWYKKNGMEWSGIKWSEERRGTESRWLQEGGGKRGLMVMENYNKNFLS